jgi:hypothetical protein
LLDPHVAAGKRTIGQWAGGGQKVVVRPSFDCRNKNNWQWERGGQTVVVRPSFDCRNKNNWPVGGRGAKK